MNTHTHTHTHTHARTDGRTQSHTHTHTHTHKHTYTHKHTHTHTHTHTGISETDNAAGCNIYFFSEPGLNGTASPFASHITTFGARVDIPKVLFRKNGRRRVVEAKTTGT